jgi:hypothetical protein
MVRLSPEQKNSAHALTSVRKTVLHRARFGSPACCAQALTGLLAGACCSPRRMKPWASPNARLEQAPARALIQHASVSRAGSRSRTGSVRSLVGSGSAHARQIATAPFATSRSATSSRLNHPRFNRHHLIATMRSNHVTQGLVRRGWGAQVALEAGLLECRVA